MRKIVWIIFLFLGMIANGGNILNYISLGELNIKPDVLIIFMVYFAINSEANQALIGSFFFGFGADLIALPMGPFMIAYLIAGSLISNLKKSSLIHSMIFQAIIIFLVTAFVLGAAEFIKFIANKELSSHFWSRFFFTSIYTAVVGPFIYKLPEIVEDMLGIKKQA